MSHIPGLNISKHITLSKTAEEWELYTSNPYSIVAAEAINSSIEMAYNAGGSRSEVEAVALKVMRFNEDMGAMDSEPLCHLEELLDHLYGGK